MGVSFGQAAKTTNATKKGIAKSTIVLALSRGLGDNARLSSNKFTRITLPTPFALGPLQMDWEPIITHPVCSQWTNRNEPN